MQITKNSNTTYSAFFAKYYDILYEEKVHYQQGANNLISTFKQYHLQKNHLILDIGCGTGSHALHIAHQNYSVIGIDISPDMIFQAQQKITPSLSHLTFLCSSIEQFTTKAHHAYALFNVINCMYDINDLVSFFTHVAKQLLSGGIFIFECWHTETIRREPPQKITDSLYKNNIFIERTVTPSFKKKDNIVKLEYLYTINKEERHTVLHRLKLFTQEEIENVLAITGFKKITTYNKIHNQKPISQESREICFITQKI